MNSLKKINPEQMTENPFQLIGKDWALLSADKPDGSCNMMTVSWGGVGVLWGKPVAFVFVRPGRYTKEFVDASDHFSLSFFDEQYRDALSLCGSKSGRDIDKIAATGLTRVSLDGVSAFEEAKLALCCQKLYTCPFSPDRFLSPDIEKHYPLKDYHEMYIGEIVGAYTK